MFGMEEDEKGKKTELFFDLEKEIVSDPANYKELKTKIKERVEQLKNVLREGTDKENYDKYGILLHGYVSLQKVIARVRKKPR